MTVKAWEVSDAYSGRSLYVEGTQAEVIDGALVITVARGELWKAFAAGQWTYVTQVELHPRPNPPKPAKTP